MTKQLEYELADGTRVPLFEAEYDTAFKIFKSDRRKAKVGDPKACIEALGICRKPNVLEAHIGSGKDAYVVYSKTPGRSFKHAVHHTMPAQSGRVRDQFEVKGSPKTQTLFLKAPSSGRTLAHRKTLDKKRRAEVQGWRAGQEARQAEQDPHSSPRRCASPARQDQGRRRHAVLGAGGAGDMIPAKKAVDITAASIEAVLIKGDLLKLTEEQRLEYYNSVCKLVRPEPAHPAVRLPDAQWKAGALSKQVLRRAVRANSTTSRWKLSARI